MVEALQDLSVPLVAPTNQCTPVGAGIQENTHLAIATTHEEKGPTGHVAAPVVTWFFYLRFVAQVQPALVKNSLLLHLKNLRRCHSGAMNSEDTVFRVVYDKTSKFHHVWPPLSSSFVNFSTTKIACA
jgi:hypothetical protein